MKMTSVRDCRTCRDFERVAAKQGGFVEHGKGHDKIRNPGVSGCAVVPRHTGDLATGTCRAIIKALLMLGFSILVVVIVVQAFQAVAL